MKKDGRARPRKNRRERISLLKIHYHTTIYTIYAHIMTAEDKLHDYEKGGDWADVYFDTLTVLAVPLAQRLLQRPLVGGNYYNALLLVMTLILTLDVAQLRQKSH